VTEIEGPPRGGPDGPAREAPARDGAVRLSTEGVDLLTLAGVNDANLVELARITGARLALRGEALTLGGSAEQLERAVPIAERMIVLARQRVTLTPDDVLRISLDPRNATRGDGAASGRDGSRPENGEAGDGLGGPPLPGTGAEGRLALPGVRRLIQAKTAGQAEYMKKIAEHDVVIGIGPAGTARRTWPSPWPSTRSCASACVASCSRDRPSRRASRSASCRATCRPRSTRTCARSTTRSTR
jgi:phosphate starvation-inducible PhoH-like protein